MRARWFKALRLAAASGLREVQGGTGDPSADESVEVNSGHGMSKVEALAMIAT